MENPSVVSDRMTPHSNDANDRACMRGNTMNWLRVVRNDATCVTLGASAAKGRDLHQCPDSPARTASEAEEPSIPCTDGDRASSVDAPAWTRRIAVFIDLANVRLHLDRIGDTVSVERIQAVLREFGEIDFLFAFTDTTRVPHEVLRDLADRSVNVINCPKQPGPGGGLTDTVDRCMRMLIERYLRIKDITTIAMVTNDNDFVEIAAEAKRRQREVIVLVGEPNASAELQRVADHVEFIGSPFLHNVAACALRLRGNADAMNFARIAETHPMAMGALAEIIRIAARDPDGMPPRLLRDRGLRAPSSMLQTAALPEEALTCVRVLEELGCLVPRSESASDDRRRNLLTLRTDHPFVAWVLRDPPAAALET